MSETKRSSKALRLVAAIVMVVLLVGGVFTSLVRSHAMTNEEYCYQFLTNNMGLNTAAAAGLLANFAEESSFNPSIDGDGGSSFGLCQWNKSRKDAMISYCNSKGLRADTLYGQLSYLQYELQTEYPELLNTLKSTVNNSSGAYNAGYRFCYDFERPAAKESKSQSRGSAASRTYFPKYAGTVAPASTTTAYYTTTTTAPATTTAVKGNYVVATDGSNLNLRSTPSTEGAVVGKVANGTSLNITQTSNGWGKVNVNGVDGWVSMQYVKAA